MSLGPARICCVFAPREVHARFLEQPPTAQLKRVQKNLPREKTVDTWPPGNATAERRSKISPWADLNGRKPLAYILYSLS